MKQYLIGLIPLLLTITVIDAQAQTDFSNITSDPNNAAAVEMEAKLANVLDIVANHCKAAADAQDIHTSLLCVAFAKDFTTHMKSLFQNNTELVNDAVGLGN